MFFTPKPGNTLLYRDVPSSPPTDAERDAAAILTTATVLKATEKQDPAKDWVKVTARLNSGDRAGWVRSAKIEPRDPPEPEPLDPWSFVKNCTLAARVVNAEQADSGHGINRDFMIAYALEETGSGTAALPQNIVTDEENPASMRTGPFAFTMDQWDKFVASSSNTSGFQASDVRDPIFQCYGFADRTFRATQAISNRFSVADQATSSGPYIPSTVELFIYLAIGEEAAFAFINAMAAGQSNQRAGTLLASSPDADGIRKRYGRFFGSVAQESTIADFEAKLATSLQKHLKRAFTLVREHTPEDIIYFTSGTLPWLAKAREEQVKGVAETGTPPNPEVLKYFSATGLSPTTEIAWCGAFVAWCLMNCGSELAAKSVRKATAARAASWKTWGDVEVSIGVHEDSAAIPGTIVVLRPQTSDTSGHVGFLVKLTADSVTLLAGNQGNAVNEETYGRKEIVAMRLLKGIDSVPSANSGPGTADPNFGGGMLGPFTAEDWAIYTDVLGTSESSNNYRAVNPIGYCGRWQFGAEALIDGGYVKGGATTRLLGQDRWWTGKNAVRKRDDWLANVNSCQDQEMIAYTQRNYKSLLNIRVTRPFTEGAPKAQLAGLLAASHLVGTGGVRKMILGQNPSDANGTTARKYFKMMSRAFGGSATPPSA